jgi:toxin ParE1/3/4
MSAPRLAIAFAADARKDLRGILLHSKQQCGARQRDDYKRDLDRAFDALRANPEMGRPRPDVGSGVRSFVVRRHLILYRVSSDTIRVLRVLHQRMDVAGVVDTLA